MTSQVYQSLALQMCPFLRDHLFCLLPCCAGVSCMKFVFVSFCRLGHFPTRCVCVCVCLCVHVRVCVCVAVGMYCKLVFSSVHALHISRGTWWPDAAGRHQHDTTCWHCVHPPAQYWGCYTRSYPGCHTDP